MRRRLALAVLLMGAVGVAVTTSAKPPGLPDEIPVTVTFTDGSAWAIQSDGRGPYTHGAGGVRAVLVSAGNLALDTDYTATPVPRKLFLDFTGACSGPCDPTFDALTVVAFVSTTACENTGGLRDMPIGTSQECNLNVNFGADGLGWFVRFGEYDGTTPATVDRLADGSWTIDVPAGGVARLLSYPTKGRMVLTPRGDFVMPVHVTVTQP